jgi:hypothetical protein
VSLVLHVVAWLVAVKSKGRLPRGCSLKKPIPLAAAMLGIARSSIYNLMSEDKERLESGEAARRERVMLMTEEELAEIRPAILELIVEKKPLRLIVRLDTILDGHYRG